MITTYNKDCNEGLKDIPDNSIDIILTDPPYKYLKNQKLEVDFDETVFFNHVKRILKKEGFIVMFGRGTSFYRWNTMLADLGFQFKEEIVWDKLLITSAVTTIGRKHETVSIHTIDGKINKVKVPFFEIFKYEPKKIKRTIERLQTVFGNRESFDLLKTYFEQGKKIFTPSVESKFNVARSANSNLNQNRTIQFACTLEEGAREQSIIQQMGDHYDTIHPTQKPVRLLERLLALVMKPNHDGNSTCLDPFMGSGSTAIAAYNMGLDFIGYELDKEYFEGAEKRIKQATAQQRLFV